MNADDPNDIGRPLITLEDLPDNWEERILSLAKEGASIVELAVELGIARSTFYDLSKRDSDFSNTIKKCKDFSEDWWEKQGRTNLKNKEFNYVGWYMNMKNRFGWKDRKDVTSGGESLNTGKVDAELAAQFAKFMKDKTQQ